MMRPVLTLGFAAVVLLAPLPGMLRAEEAAAAEDAAPKVAVLPSITVTEVHSRPLADRIIASGLIAAVEEVQVVPLIEGQPLETLLADVGDWVEAGQVLARLSSSTLELQKTEALAAKASAEAAIAQGEAQLIEAEASAAEAERVLDRTTALKANGTAPQATWDTANAAKIAGDARVLVATQGLEAARAQLALAEARLETAELYLRRTEVKAP
ncbi:MAG: efflux RND transporter periplasmic adaptor subunit, partial [Tabrizicola sp.]|nr:efflux RND transporter periplasmic adaptor subunit [Tabrizicola sp.]